MSEGEKEQRLDFDRVRGRRVREPRAKRFNQKLVASPKTRQEKEAPATPHPHCHGLRRRKRARPEGRISSTRRVKCMSSHPIEAGWGECVPLLFVAPSQMDIRVVCFLN